MEAASVRRCRRAWRSRPSSPLWGSTVAVPPLHLWGAVDPSRGAAAAAAPPHGGRAAVAPGAAAAVAAVEGRSAVRHRGIEVAPSASAVPRPPPLSRGRAPPSPLGTPTDPTVAGCDCGICCLSSDGHGGVVSLLPAAIRVESYKLDWCYEQEDISEIFSREVKPLLQGVFHGFDASILAYGARDSGKTQLIEGSDEKPGLAFFTINEILACGEKNGKEVMISCYEVHHDHVFDLLKLKDQEIQVLENAAGKVQFKGLSQVPIKTMQDFKRLYHGCNQQIPVKKDANHVASRRHKGLIIYIPSFHDGSNASLARMNIVDLAGYEDAKLKKAGPYLTESSKINRSLYALHNVVFALNAKDGRVPYRDNKLTHLLKDFISRESQVLMITCLKPTPCADTIQVASISSRSCLSANNPHLKSFRKKSSERPPWHSPSDQRANRLPSSRDKACSISMKKPAIPRFGTTPNKGCLLQSPPTARKLFNMKVLAINSMEEKPILNIDAERESSGPEEKENSTLLSTVIESSVLDEGNLESTLDVSEPSTQESCATDDRSYLKNAHIVSQLNTLDTQKDSTVEHEHMCPDVEIGSSPPISERLREISNTLKLLSCQPLSITHSQEKDVSSTRQDGTDNMEPRTPLRQLNVAFSGTCDAGKTATPKERFRTRSTGLKNSLVEECLMFLNNASKEELLELKGIGEKRLTYILELREEDPEPFKELNDLQQIGLTPTQAKGLMRNVVAEFFN